MRFRSTIVLGIPLLLVLQGSSAAEQRPSHSKYIRPPFTSAQNPALPRLPWEGLAPPSRIATGPTTEDDRHWGSEFGLPIPNGTVECIAIFGGDVIIGGDFTQIGGKSVGYISRWDGAEWLSIGGVDGPVTALMANGPDLFVGGKFRSAGGVPAPGIARWDGSAWHAVGGDIAGSGGRFDGISAFALYHGDLIAAGDFASSIQPSIRGIARFDGSDWKPLGNGLNGPATVATVFRDSLYVAGSFDSAGTIQTSRIARWDGAGWAGLADGINYGSYVSSMAVYKDTLFVGGDFFEAGGVQSRSLAAWDGAQWQSTNSGYYYHFFAVHSMAVHQDKLYVDGNSWGLDWWDGTNWSGDLVLGGWCTAMVSDGTDLIVAGNFTSFPEPGASNIGRWDGLQFHGYESWNSKMNGLAAGLFGLGSAYPAHVTSLASYGGELLAVGFISRYGSEAGWGEDLTQAVPAWSGSSWRTFDSISPPFGPLPPSYYGLPTPLHSTGTSLYIGGQFSSDPDTPHAVLKFGGASWSAMDTLSGHATAITTVNGDQYVAVDRTPYACGNGVTPSSSILRWAKDHWDEIGVASAGTSSSFWCTSAIVGLSEYQGELIAYGIFDTISGVLARGVAGWNGNEWRSLADGPSGCVFATGNVSATVGDRLGIVTYKCSDLDLQDLTIEVWDGRAWGVVPNIEGHISTIASIRGLLYVGGRFQLDGIGSNVSVATWDGIHWEQLGTGLDSGPTAIVEHDGAVYFGGPFSTAGGKSSFGIARWDELRRAPPLRTPRLSSARPNPFLATAYLSLQLDGEGVVRVAVYDVNGREISVLEDGFRSAGPHGIRWDGRDRLGKQVPAGVYFISARSANGATTSRKVVRLR